MVMLTNSKLPKTQWFDTPLFLACGDAEYDSDKKNHVEVVRLVLSWGADLHYCDEVGRSM